MKPPRAVLNLVLVLLVVGLVGGAIVASSGGSSSPAPPSPAQPSATAFADAYIAYLDGLESATALTGATSEVTAIARQGGSIPPPSRAGRLRVIAVRLRGVGGAPTAAATIEATDRRHALQASVGLRFAAGAWRVVSLVPPDFATILAGRTGAAPRTPLALRRAAARFALAYVDYMEGASRRLPSTGATIVHQIDQRQDPLAGIAPTRVRASLISLRFGAPQGAVRSATAVIADRGRHSVTFVLSRTATSWRPAAFVQGVGG